MNLEKKVVDLEQKSEKVEHLVISVLSNIFQPGDFLNIETQSYIIYFSMLNTSNLVSILRINDNIIQLPSFCALKNNINNCSYQTIILKVSGYLFLFLKSFVLTRSKYF